MILAIEKIILEIPKEWQGFELNQQKINLADVPTDQFEGILSRCLRSRGFGPADNPYILEINCANTSLTVDGARALLSCLYQKRVKQQMLMCPFYFTFIEVGNNLQSLQAAITKDEKGSIPSVIAANLEKGSGFELVGQKKKIGRYNLLFEALNETGGWVLGVEFAKALSSKAIFPSSLDGMYRLGVCVKKFHPSETMAALYHSVIAKPLILL